MEDKKSDDKLNNNAKIFNIISALLGSTSIILIITGFFVSNFSFFSASIKTAILAIIFSVIANTEKKEIRKNIEAGKNEETSKKEENLGKVGMSLGIIGIIASVIIVLVFILAFVAGIYLLYNIGKLDN